MTPDQLKAHLAALYPGFTISSQVQRLCEDLNLKERVVWRWLAGERKNPQVPAEIAIKLLRRVKRR